MPDRAPHRQRDVGADAARKAVIDRPHLKAGLHLPPGVLDAEKLLVAKGQVCSRQGVVVAGDDELAVEAGSVADSGLVQRGRQPSRE